MAQEHTEEDLRALIVSFKEGLQLYAKSIAETPLATLKSQEITDPDVELAKLAKILSAHATKIGIAFRPPASINAAYEQLKETSSKMLLIVSVVSQFDEVKWSNLYQHEIIHRVQNLIGNFITLLDELTALDFKEERREVVESDKVDGRLVSVGRIWESCKTLETLMNNGKMSLLKEKIKLSVSLVEDATEEFTEWLENPEIVDDADPFGFNDADSLDQLNDNNNNNNDDDDDEVGKVDPQLLEFAEKWTQKIRMLKLLLNSLIKSLPSHNNSSGEEIDEFNKEQNALIEQIDDLVASVFMNQALYQIKNLSKEIEKQSAHLIKLVKDLNKDDEKKTKWLDLWMEKFLL